ncbi:MAG: TetR/AcrR family transcriptional regulator [Bacteroidota bacterium]
MEKTRKKILAVARNLFNEHGVADISLRRIAKEMGISHSNLIYHFKTKNDIIFQLHSDILHSAKVENEKLQVEEDRILGLWKTTLVGFGILYDYRFFLMDLSYILKENRTLHDFFLEVEHIRADMYLREIEAWKEKDLMREEEYEGEYQQLIKRIRIFSDSWITSSQVYDEGKSSNLIIQEYASLLISEFYPYLTDEGKITYRNSFLS